MEMHVLLALLLSSNAAPKEAAGVPPEALVQLLRRHAEAMGGVRALAVRQRWRLTERVTEHGLEGTRVTVAEGSRRRVESRFPALPLEGTEVWDGDQLFTRDTNGNVRRLRGADEEGARSHVLLTSLSYLAPGTSALVEGLPQSEVDGVRQDRIRVTAPGALAVELWLDGTGLPRRSVLSAEGQVRTCFIDAYANFQGVPFAQRQRCTLSSERGQSMAQVLKLERPDSLPETLFQPPKGHLDATFPQGLRSFTLPLSLWDGRYVTVQARLGGELGTFLLDTGAETSLFDLAFLKKVGVTPKGEIAQSAGLLNVIRFARVPPLEFGALRFGAQTVSAADLHAADSIFPDTVDGILGYDFLSRFPFTLDYPGGWLTFWKPGGYQPGPEELKLPFELTSTELRVHVSINGQAAGQFLLDTGNGGLPTVQHSPVTRALMPKNGEGRFFPRGMEFGSGAASSFLTHADLTVGTGPRTLTWKAAPIRVLNLDDPDASKLSGVGNLGFTWLRHFRVTIDYAASTLYLLQREAFLPSSLDGDFGLRLRMNQGKLVIWDLGSNAPAALAGLRVGDELLSVDEVPVILQNHSAPRVLVNARPGERRVVRVRRGKEALTVTLTASPFP